MATAFTHAFAAIALATTAPSGDYRFRLFVVGAVLAVIPDLDVVAFRFGIEYGHPLGHRGFTHSLPFAALAGVSATTLAFREFPRGSHAWWSIAGLLALCTASHGILDAFTDAGLGVGFFIPLTDARYFFPWRPLATSPLGVSAFFSGPTLSILWNEFLWVWLPVGTLSLLLPHLAKLRKS